MTSIHEPIDLTKDVSPIAIDEASDLNQMLSSQVSSTEELIQNADIARTEELIAQGRMEGAELHDLTGEEEEVEEEEEYEAWVARSEQYSLWDIVKKGSINIILPFINGVMLGFGEILAHEIGFRYNWYGAKVSPQRRMARRQQESKFI